MAFSLNYVWFLLLFFGASLGAALGAASAAEELASFGLEGFGKGSGFESEFALIGDSRVGDGGEFLQVTQNWSFSAGRVVYKNPIKLMMEGNLRAKRSFSTFFTFSLSGENGDGLLFLMVPEKFRGKKSLGFSEELAGRRSSAFAVEFDTKMDAKYGDVNDNHVGIDVNSFVSVKVANASNAKLVLNNGGKLHCWIDYEASSKRLEVRMSKFGEIRPLKPLLSCPIDLAKYFKSEDVWFSLSSSNANSSQICKLYSWSFGLRPIPYWMHSQPLDPKALFGEKFKPVRVHTKDECYLRVLTAVIVGTVCGAMGALMALLVWTFFTSGGRVIPEEFVSAKVEYECDKLKVFVVDRDGKESSK